MPQQEKTIKWLNSKVWYRLVKVLYILSFLFLSILITSISFATIRISDYSIRNKIKQNNPEFQKNIEALESKYYSDILLLKVNELVGANIFSDAKTELTQIKEREAIKKSILNIFILLIIYIIIRRIFYYIVLGKFKPIKE